jgi:ribosomal protein S18 acetylase RimI-like enzyme
MAAFDPVVSLRIINCDRLMRAAHRGEYRNLGGALALTSDAPLPAFNHLEGFDATEPDLDVLLDVGFSLLRAFDCEPAVLLTPLDRPPSIAERLRARRLVPAERDTAMVWRGDRNALPDAAVEIVRVDPELSVKFAAVEHQAFGAPAWAKSFLRSAALANVLDERQAFYLAYADGEPVATTRVFRDGMTAGIYSVGTLRAHRKRGIASALVARAIRDALDAEADVVSLTAASGSPAMALYERLGFVVAHETTLWVSPAG